MLLSPMAHLGISTATCNTFIFNVIYQCLTHVGLCAFGLPISFVMIERIYILCLIIIIKSEVWTITHCLGLGHEKNGTRCMSSYILTHTHTYIYIYMYLYICTFLDNSIAQKHPVEAILNSKLKGHREMFEHSIRAKSRSLALMAVAIHSYI